MTETNVIELTKVNDVIHEHPYTRPQTQHKWTTKEVLAILEQPFMNLVFQAQTILRQHFPANQIQRSSLLSIKTGGCSEDCGYCSQSVRHKTEVEREQLMSLEEVVKAAKTAKENGATRFCMGAAWRGPKDKDLDRIIPMIQAVKQLGLETCVTLGLLKDGQAEKLKASGLDYYNHNIDTSAEFYGTVITTHCMSDRINTLDKVREAGINICCGGILGLGENRRDRAAMIKQLANMNPAPESVPINHLIAVEGTPLEDTPPLDIFEFIRTIAAARITMPTSYVRIAAGRTEMTDEAQALCFLAGANSIFYGDQLLTEQNPQSQLDDQLFLKLGLNAV